MNIKHYFIFNPIAGNGKQLSDLIKSVEKICGEKLVDYEVYLTKKIGDATNFVKSHCEVYKNKICRFYACGGDGTICEVVNGAAGYDNAEFGVIPVGTGNDFVRNFGDKKQFFDITSQLEAEPIEIDLIKYNDRYSANMINIGFDCEVAKDASDMRDNALVPKALAYIAGLVKELKKMAGVKLHAVIDGVDVGEKDLLLTTVANGGFCGGGFHSSPTVSLDDGIMDVGFVKKVTRRKFISLVGAYKNGTLPEKKAAAELCEYYKCREIILDFDSPQRVCIDGEIEEHKHINIQIIQKAIKFALPKGLTYQKFEPSENAKEAATV